MVLDMRRDVGRFRHQDRPHAERQWSEQVAYIVIEHGCAFRHKAVSGDDGFESDTFGLWKIACVLDTVNWGIYTIVPSGRPRTDFTGR
ncbi:MAG: hypothetical protein OXH79_03385 [Boseongicola sp.]|nr:hypothetical protein [Boseongicola sp.]